jgi:GTP-binding protein
MEAYSLGLGEPIAMSAEHGEVWSIVRTYPPYVEREEGAEEEEGGEGPLKLAIVGRPNAGKSTLINKMLQQDRLITGPEAGITRDSIAIDWQWKDRPVRLIDTAGMRKKAKVDDKLEKAFRCRCAARGGLRRSGRAPPRWHARPGVAGPSHRRQRPSGRRALIIAINKWDIAEKSQFAVQRHQGGAGRRAEPGARHTPGHGFGRDGQRHRPAARRRLRGARDLVEARLDRDSSTAGSRKRSSAIRRPRRAASASSCATSRR